MSALHCISTSVTHQAFPTCPEADTTATLLYDVSDRTGIPTVESRLTYNGRQLTSSNESLSSYGITSGATIGLALRLRGGGPKKRCGHYIAATERCSSVSLRIVGDCNFCEVSFCGRHRLPEGESTRR